MVLASRFEIDNKVESFKMNICQNWKQICGAITPRFKIVTYTGAFLQNNCRFLTNEKNVPAIICVKLSHNLTSMCL